MGRAKDFTLIAAEERWGHMVNDRFVLVENKVINGTRMGLYKFVVQPEFCTHTSCGFEGGKYDEKKRLIKPKCSYQSWRKATPAELSDPALKDIYIACYVTYINKEADRRMGLALFDCSADKFVEGWMQDGGNERLVFQSEQVLEFVTTQNYGDLVNEVKKGL